MIAVIVLSGFICAPKADAADTAKPEVTVLGATLRLNKEGDNKNAQSMRIGIKITNADKAKDCAIKLELNGKSYTVATSEAALDSENGKVHNTVHSIDKANNSVVYAVVLTNIPKTSFYDSITITGKAISNDEQATITTSTAEQRNVMGIVNSLQKKYPDLGITINDNGTLVKNNGKDLTNNDLNGYNTDDPQEYETVKLEPDISGIENVTIDDQGNIIVNQTEVDIIQFPINEVTVGDTVVVHITGTIGENSSGLRVYPDTGGDRCMVENYVTISDKGVFDKTIEYVIYDHDGKSNGGAKDDCNTAKSICIKGPNSWIKLKDVTITSLSVTYKGGNPAPTEPGVLDLSKATGANGGVQLNDDGSVTKNGDSEYIVIPLGAEYKSGDVLKVTVWGSSDQPVRLWISSGVWTAISNQIGSNGAPAMEFGVPYELTLTADTNNSEVQVKRQDPNPENLNITKVKVEKIASAEPTPSPEPAPEEYEISGEALSAACSDVTGNPSKSKEYDSVNNVMKVSFADLSGVLFNLPDKFDTSVYKYVQIKYTSTGEDIGVYQGEAQTATHIGTLTPSKTEVTLQGDFSEGLIKLFGIYTTADVAIESIKFYKNNPETATNL